MQALIYYVWDNRREYLWINGLRFTRNVDIYTGQTVAAWRTNQGNHCRSSDILSCCIISHSSTVSQHSTVMSLFSVYLIFLQTSSLNWMNGTRLFVWSAHAAAQPTFRNKSLILLYTSSLWKRIAYMRTTYTAHRIFLSDPVSRHYLPTYRSINLRTEIVHVKCEWNYFFLFSLSALELHRNAQQNEEEPKTNSSI